MGSVNSIILITNVNGQNNPIKKQRLSDWVKKKDPNICCLQETQVIVRITNRLKVK